MRTTQSNLLLMSSVVLLAACLVGNMRALETLQERSRPAAAQAAADKLDVPPTLAITTMALGPLRGLIVDGLWWRMIQHQDEGRFFETIQLTNWITALQPRFAQVWAFNAWNLAYNVAYEFPDPDMRWKWTLRAIELLRDSGLRYNPGNPVITRELVRLYLDRLGTDVDPAQETFRRNWAFITMQYVGNGQRADLERLQLVLQREDVLFADADVVSFLAQAQARGWDFTDPERGFWVAANVPELGEILTTSEQKRAFRGLFEWIRAKELQRVLKLNIEHALFVDREYGPFDWRLPQAHAVYWAVRERLPFQDVLKESDGQLRNLIRQGMEQSFRDGRLIWNPKTGLFITSNNLRIVGRIHDYYDSVVEDDPNGTGRNLHRDFLCEASVVLYGFNHVAAARDLYTHYVEDYVPAGTTYPFELFIADNMQRVIRGAADGDAKSLVEGALFQAYLGLAMGDTRRAGGHARLARLAWNLHQRRYPPDSPKRLPPFNDMKQSVLQRLLMAGIEPSLAAELRNDSVDPELEPADSSTEIDVGALGTHSPRKTRALRDGQHD